MAITTLDGLLSAMGNSSQTLIINKASITGQVAGGFTSLWRATGTPTAGAIPAAAAVCNSALTGAIPFTNPVSGLSYLARLSLTGSAGNTEFQVHDRLAHMGGMSGIVTTAQTASVDVSGSTSSMVARRGDPTYDEVQWWLEWYTVTGGTGVTATISYTNGAGTSGRTTTVSVPATTQPGRMLPILPTSGDTIQSVQSVTLSATTGAAGSFGVTATRPLTSLMTYTINVAGVADWASLGLPAVNNDACLMLMCIPAATSTGTIVGFGKLAQG